MNYEGQMKAPKDPLWETGKVLENMAKAIGIKHFKGNRCQIERYPSDYNDVMISLKKKKKKKLNIHINAPINVHLCHLI